MSGNWNWGLPCSARSEDYPGWELSYNPDWLWSPQQSKSLHFSLQSYVNWVGVSVSSAGDWRSCHHYTCHCAWSLLLCPFLGSSWSRRRTDTRQQLWNFHAFAVFFFFLFSLVRKQSFHAPLFPDKNIVLTARGTIPGILVGDWQGT